MTSIKRYSLTLIIAAAIIIEVIGAVQYFMARSGVRNEVLDKAGRDMRESQRVALVKNEVETALKNAEHSIKLTLVNPETSYAVASRLIRVNPHIIGVGVAFLPNYFKEKGRHGLFMPYTYDDQPSIIKKGKRTGAPHIQTRIPDLDYTKRDWYHTAMGGECKWTEPYLGEGGINVLMCTYSIPVKDKNDRIVGVLFADVTIVILFIQLISFLLMGFIIWRAASASRRYKEQYVDPDKEHLVEQMAKLREVNARLIKRNQDLAQKYIDLRNRLNTPTQVNDQEWFG